MAEKKRLVIYSPHWDHLFGITLWHWKNKKRVVPKYGYLVKELVNNNHNIDVAFYVEKPERFSWLPLWTRAKFLFWAYINGLKISKIKTLISPKEIKQNDIFFALSRMALQHKPLTFLKDKDIIKLFHMTHFMNNTSLISQNSQDIGVSYFIAENNLYKNSDFFKKHFSFYKQDVYVLPFVYQDRFKNTKPFDERINKCFITGSLSIWKGDEVFLKDFFEFYENIDHYHLARKFIYENKEALKNEIDCFISSTITKKTNKEEEKDNNQKYFKSFDLVEKLNEYKMFVSAEELNDLPSIGFIEGMACGCAYIAKKDPMYEDIGFVDGVNYIAYDGTMEDLQSKIKYYQEHAKELKEIAKNGYEFISTNFNSQKVTERFIDDLLDLTENGKLRSSFVK